MSQDAEDRMRGWLDRAATRMSKIGVLLSEDVAPASSDSPSLPPPPGSASGALLPLLPAAAAAGAASSGSSTVFSPVGDISPQGGAAAPGTLLGAALSAAPATASHAAQQQPAGEVPHPATEPAASGAGSVTSLLAPQHGPEAAAQQEQGSAATAGGSWLQSQPPLRTQSEASAPAMDPAAAPAATVVPATEPAGGASPTASVGSAPSPSPQRSLSDAPTSAPFAAAGGTWLATQTPPERSAAASGGAAVPAAAPPLPAGSPEAAHSDAAPSAGLLSPARRPSQGLIELLDGFNGSSGARAPVQPVGSSAGDPAAARGADGAGSWADDRASPQQQSTPPSAAALRAHAAEQSDGSEASEEVDSSEALLQQVCQRRNMQCYLAAGRAACRGVKTASSGRDGHKACSSCVHRTTSSFQQCVVGLHQPGT